MERKWMEGFGPEVLPESVRERLLGALCAQVGVSQTGAEVGS
jgi:CBS-domain-containing membrane protein